MRLPSLLQRITQRFAARPIGQTHRPPPQASQQLFRNDGFDALGPQRSHQAIQRDAQYVIGLYKELTGRQPDAVSFFSAMSGLANGMPRDDLKQMLTRQVGAAGSKAPVTHAEWKETLFSLLKQKGLGDVATPQALAAIEPELKALGATLQRNSAGEIRGRIYLPTGNPADPYGRPVDVVQGAGWGDRWGWTTRGPDRQRGDAVGAATAPTQAPQTNDEWKNAIFWLLQQKGLGSIATPQALAAIEPELRAMGATLQRNSAGELRGRIYLPSRNGDPYSRPADLVQGAGWGDHWGWTPR